MEKHKPRNDKAIEEKFKGRNPLDEVLEILEEYDEGTLPRKPESC